MMYADNMMVYDEDTRWIPVHVVMNCANDGGGDDEEQYGLIIISCNV